MNVKERLNSMFSMNTQLIECSIMNTNLIVFQKKISSLVLDKRGGKFIVYHE